MSDCKGGRFLRLLVSSLQALARERIPMFPFVVQEAQKAGGFLVKM